MKVFLRNNYVTMSIGSTVYTVNRRVTAFSGTLQLITIWSFYFVRLFYLIQNQMQTHAAQESREYP